MPDSVDELHHLTLFASDTHTKTEISYEAFKLYYHVCSLYDSTVTNIVHKTLNVYWNVQ